MHVSIMHLIYLLNVFFFFTYCMSYDFEEILMIDIVYIYYENKFV